MKEGVKHTFKTGSLIGLFIPAYLIGNMETAAAVTTEHEDYLTRYPNEHRITTRVRLPEEPKQKIKTYIVTTARKRGSKTPQQDIYTTLLGRKFMKVSEEDPIWKHPTIVDTMEGNQQNRGYRDRSTVTATVNVVM